MEISGGLGPTADHVFRVGLMGKSNRKLNGIFKLKINNFSGDNATNERVDLLINILNEAIQSTKQEKSKI